MTVRDDANNLPDPMLRWREEVGAIDDLVSTAPRVLFEEVGFYPAVPEIVKKVHRKAGLDISSYLHIMDTDSIRHIIKSHGASQEVLRGRVPLAREDFLLISEIFGSADLIENGGKTKPGRDTIRYSKDIGSFRYYYTEEIRTKKNRLAAVTFYKRRN